MTDDQTAEYTAEPELMGTNTGAKYFVYTDAHAAHLSIGNQDDDGRPVVSVVADEPQRAAVVYIPPEDIESVVGALRGAARKAHGPGEAITAQELAHALDNSTPYPIELDSTLCTFMAERLLEMLTVAKRPEHAVWQPEEDLPTGPQPAPMDPESLAPVEDRLRCPQCGEDVTDYAEDDHVFRTGDERPYCSGECVRDALRAAEAQRVNGLPLVKGHCPACRQASLFLGTGGYPTCSNSECPEPDAATTVLEQYAHEAHPPTHTWTVETRDPLADQWAPGSHFAHRPAAVERLDTANRTAPLWNDGTPVERRIVRETTTYTVEAEHTPEEAGRG